MSWLALLGTLGEIIGKLTGIGGDWLKGQDELSRARLDAQVAGYKAEAELAAYKARSMVEWDLKWADGAVSSWKDEFLLLLWALPLIGLFIPFTAPYVMDGFEYLKTFTPDAPTWYISGWGVIFAATYGMKQALQFMLPAKYTALLGAFKDAPVDIPQEIMPTIQARVNRKPDETPKSLAEN